MHLLFRLSFSVIIKWQRLVVQKFSGNSEERTAFLNVSANVGQILSDYTASHPENNFRHHHCYNLACRVITPNSLQMCQECMVMTEYMVMIMHGDDNAW
jgi:hypothetical protein